MMNHSLSQLCWRVFAAISLAVLLILPVAAIAPPDARAGTTITVNEMTDELDEHSNVGADCSLREALFAANEDRTFGGCPAGDGADTIIIPAGVYTLTIAADGESGTDGDLYIREDLTLRGSGMDMTILDGDNRFQIITIQRWRDGPSPVVTIQDLTMRHGYGVGDGGGGALQITRDR